jgi:hypothetical protein
MRLRETAINGVPQDGEGGGRNKEAALLWPPEFVLRIRL